MFRSTSPRRRALKLWISAALLIVTGLAWTSPIAAAVAVPEAAQSDPDKAIQTEETNLWIESGTVRLRATFHRLIRPDGKPSPAAVLVHGSAPTPRANLSFYTDACLRAGLSVLAFDKRGCGESTGEFRPFNVTESESIFAELAQDAANAHKWLRAQEGIDSARVGFVGGSQAGWIMPLASLQATDTAFIVSGAGPPLSAGEEAYHGDLCGDGGVGEHTVAEADLLLKSFKGPHGFDPSPILAKTTIPMLWIFMTADSVIPTNASIERIDALITAGRINHSMHILENADHNYRDIDTGVSHDIAPIVKAWLDTEPGSPRNLNR